MYNVFMQLTPELFDLDELIASKYPANPKDHDQGAIMTSVAEFGYLERVIRNRATGHILGGHGRIDTLAEMRRQQLEPPGGIRLSPDGKWLVPGDWAEVPESKEAAAVIALNRTTELGGWNEPRLAELLTQLALTNPESLPATGYDEADIEAMLADLTPFDNQAVAQSQARATLAERFIVPPFSVLDARQGYWQARKRAWISFGIRGEEGRDNEPALSGALYDSAGYASPLDRKRSSYDDRRRRRILWDVNSNDDTSRRILAAGRKRGKAEVFGTAGDVADRTGKYATGQPRINTIYGRGEDAGGPQSMTGTSVFDPVLCEVAYRWFNVPGGEILDPFAGESTKGIVASYLGYGYTGIELRPEQVAANVSQAESVKLGPNWIIGDSARLGELLPDDYQCDLVFTSPPYYDLEVYSDLSADGSAKQTYAQFMEWYRGIFAQCVARLRDNRFLVVKVGEIRNKRGGAYHNFIGDNISLFLGLGLSYYNEAILVTAVGSLPIRTANQFARGRKLGKTHQNVLVFYKGDLSQIKTIYPQEIEYGDIAEEDASSG